jgi:hypothetical protein
MLQWLMFGVLAGIVLVLLLPLLARQTETIPGAGWFGNAYATIAMQTLGSPSISVSPNMDFSLRKRGFSQQYSSEYVKKAGKILRVTPVEDTVHRWGSKPFTFVDEKFGNTFDLRDVVFGRVEHELRKDGEMVYEESLYENGRVVDRMTFVRAFLDVGSGTQTVDMDLKQSIAPITDGWEDSTAWARLREGVRRMFLEQGKALGLMRIIFVTLSPIAGLMAGFYLFGPGALPGATGGTSIGVGASLFGLFGLGGSDEDDADGEDNSETDQPQESIVGGIKRGAGASVEALNSLGTWIRSVDVVIYKRAALAVAVVGILLAAFIVSPVGVVAFVAAALTVAATIVIGSSRVLAAFPAKLCEPVAELWMQLGLMAFDEPVIHQDHGEFEVIDGSSITDDVSNQYRFCKHWVAFALNVDADAYGRAGVESSDIVDYRDGSAVADVSADGGVEIASQLPDDWEPTNKVTNANHRGLVPSSETVRDRITTTWVRTDRWLGRFADASTGTVCERAQEEATKEFAGSERPVSDTQLMKYSLGLMSAGLVFSFVIWGGVL